MSTLLQYVVAFLIFIHGVIHFMGLIAYYPLGVIDQLPYKTTVLNGRWDLGTGGTRFYSLLWLAAGAGFILAAIGFAFSFNWWPLILLVSAAVSLIITGLDWKVAYTGAVLDLIILAALLMMPFFL